MSVAAIIGTDRDYRAEVVYFTFYVPVSSALLCPVHKTYPTGKQTTSALWSL